MGGWHLRQTSTRVSMTLSYKVRVLEIAEGLPKMGELKTFKDYIGSEDPHD
jgi:hypothetical protein